MAETTIEAIQEKPILFSGAMIRAILEGRKTQTRRVVKPQPEAKPEDLGGGFWWRCRYVESMVDIPHPWDGNFWTAEILDCANPYGKPGTRLWVRETFNVGWLDGGKVLYRADGGSAKDCGYPAEPKWKPAIHMPRWASRLTLEIEKVRVERVQEISGEDAVAEGITIPRCGCEVCSSTHRMCPADCSAAIMEYARLWDSINAKREGGIYAWNANPWIWAIPFRVIPSGRRTSGEKDCS